MADPARVRLTIDAGVARISLDRPHAHNAIDLATASEFTAAVAAVAAAPSVRAVLLHGAGPAFCVGGDVKAMAAAGDREEFLRELATVFHAGLARLAESPWPVVAAVHGAVAGAGLGLVLAADVVVAERSARLTAAYSGVGLSPDSGVSYLLPRVVGPRRAFRLSLAGETLSASEAVDWGLITEVAPDGGGLVRAEALAHQLAAAPHPATSETKRLLRAAFDRDLPTHLADEAATIARTAGSADAGARIARFVVGRRPAAPDHHP